MTHFNARWQIPDDDQLEINVIPLIDILLVVLIFITATTTFSAIRPIELELPQSHQDTSPASGALLIITHEGQYALDGNLLANDSHSLQQALAQLDNKTELLILADANTRHAHVVTALDAARQAAIERVYFATEQESGTTP